MTVNIFIGRSFPRRGLFGAKPGRVDGVSRVMFARAALAASVVGSLMATLSACVPRVAAGPGVGYAAAALPIPVPAEGAPSWAALDRLAPATRAQYLADVLAAARLLGDAPSREFLWRMLGRGDDEASKQRGLDATRAAIDAVARIAKEAGALQLVMLLDVDRAELDGADPRETAETRRRIAGLDSMPTASPASPAAGTALLGLIASCGRSLFDAAVASPSRRAPIANLCLYALRLDEDPHRYYNAVSADRPPDPRWDLYFKGLHDLAARVRRAAPRLAPVVDRLEPQLERLRARIELEGIEPPDLSLGGPLLRRLPRGGADLPLYERAPWLIVDDDLMVFGRARYGLRDHELVQRAERQLGGDAVRRLALFVVGESSADAVDAVTSLARETAMEGIDLVLASPSGQPVRLPLDLPSAGRRDRPRSVAGGIPPLVLVARPEGPLLRARDGDLLLPTTQLDARLAELRRAFPDAGEIALAVDPLTRYRTVVELALTARRTFQHLTVVPVPRPPPSSADSSAFATRLRRRTNAEVSLTDEKGKDLQAGEWLRGCYLDALDRRPDVLTSITLSPNDLTVAPIDPQPEGPPDVEGELRACLVGRLRSWGARLAAGARWRVELRARQPRHSPY